MKNTVIFFKNGNKTLIEMTSEEVINIIKNNVIFINSNSAFVKINETYININEIDYFKTFKEETF